MTRPQLTIVPLVGGEVRQFEGTPGEEFQVLVVEEGEEPSFLLSTEEIAGVQIKSYDARDQMVRIDDADIYYPLRRIGSVKLVESRFPTLESGIGKITLVVYLNTDDFWLKNLVERSNYNSFGLEPSEDDQPGSIVIRWGTRDALEREGYIQPDRSRDEACLGVEGVDLLGDWHPLEGFRPTSGRDLLDPWATRRRSEEPFNEEEKWILKLQNSDDDDK